MLREPCRSIDRAPPPRPMHHATAGRREGRARRGGRPSKNRCPFERGGFTGTRGRAAGAGGSGPGRRRRGRPDGDGAAAPVAEEVGGRRVLEDRREHVLPARSRRLSNWNLHTTDAGVELVVQISASDADGDSFNGELVTGSATPTPTSPSVSARHRGRPELS